MGYMMSKIKEKGYEIKVDESKKNFQVIKNNIIICTVYHDKTMCMHLLGKPKMTSYMTKYNVKQIGVHYSLLELEKLMR